ncbi:MAG: hypothetical protein K9H49_13700 [Bacteroidales bacterium]|nr:hypothetical protein [Bacteroidales bacterium]MCF8390508.1 hypothetical protein [Bacteroidales bacterium]
MGIRVFFTVIILGLLTIITSCETEDPSPDVKKNPYELEAGWNGFIMDDTEFETPNAIIEIWGENMDSLSSDYDINFTDGTFNPQIRDISGSSILVYFDVNSPSLDELSSGIYYYKYTDSPERLPNKIVEAYILITTETSVIKYPILEATVEVKSQDGYFLIEYLLQTVKDQEIIDVAGQYTGMFELIDQTFN